MCNISEGNWDTSFKNIKLYVVVVTLWTQDNSELLQKLISGFERTIDWNKYQSKVSIERQNQNLDYLIDLVFQGVIRLFVLPFKNNSDRAGHIDQPVKNSLRT